MTTTTTTSVTTSTMTTTAEAGTREKDQTEAFRRDIGLNQGEHILLSLKERTKRKPRESDDDDDDDRKPRESNDDDHTNPKPRESNDEDKSEERQRERLIREESVPLTVIFAQRAKTRTTRNTTRLPMAVPPLHIILNVWHSSTINRPAM